MAQRLGLLPKASSSAGVKQFSISLASARLCWFAHREDLASVPGQCYLTADNECSVSCLLLLPISGAAVLLTWRHFSTVKVSVRTQVLFKMLNTSLCGNISAVPRGGVILTYGIEIPCGTDSYAVHLCSFSHLPPDPVLGCVSITPPPWGRNPQPTQL